MLAVLGGVILSGPCTSETRSKSSFNPATFNILQSILQQHTKIAVCRPPSVLHLARCRP